MIEAERHFGFGDRYELADLVAPHRLLTAGAEAELEGLFGTGDTATSPASDTDSTQDDTLTEAEDLFKS